MAKTINKNDKDFNLYVEKVKKGEIKLKQLNENINEYKILQRLEESSVYSLDNVKEIEHPKEIIVESSNGVKKSNSVISAYKVPVSKYTENANGRIYPKSLWEKVIREKQGEGSYSLFGHPENEENDANPKNAYGVWSNLCVEETECTAILTLFGVNGQHAHDALQAGGFLGTSSVSWGEIDESDGKTVLEDSLELSRIGDWVLN